MILLQSIRYSYRSLRGLQRLDRNGGLVAAGGTESQGPAVSFPESPAQDPFSETPSMQESSSPTVVKRMIPPVGER
jgi:hypothetical protein